ncbi:MAG: DUF4238 domain-containing protein [bacterium]|nr:DUF4238 domain-containing protein [bacterium]
MGRHYIPREYLRGFQIPNESKVYAYDKTGNSFPVSIEKIAQETSMYSDETEEFLNNDIEQPANKLLKRLRCSRILDTDEKYIFSKYMYNLHVRTPDSYQEFIDSTPEFIEKIRSENLTLIDSMIENSKSKSEVLKNRRSEINSILDSFKKNPPKIAWENSLDPEISNKSAKAMSQMTWVLFYENYDCFLTCDKPLFYFKGLGIANNYSEFSFPISSRIVLWGSWRTDFNDTIIRANNKVVRNLNNRTLSNVYRHAFMANQKPWVTKVIRKEKIDLQMIR